MQPDNTRKREALNGYRDSEKLAQTAYASHEIAIIREAEVGER